MNREEILETLKELILVLKNNKDLFARDALFVAYWTNKQKAVASEIAHLSPEDNAWLNTEYEKWFQEANISSDLPSIDLDTLS